MNVKRELTKNRFNPYTIIIDVESQRNEAVLKSILNNTSLSNCMLRNGDNGIAFTQQELEAILKKLKDILN